MLQQRLAETEPSGLYSAPDAPPAGVSPSQDLSALGAAAKLSARKAKINAAIDDGS